MTTMTVAPAPRDNNDQEDRSEPQQKACVVDCCGIGFSIGNPTALWVCGFGFSVGRPCGITLCCVPCMC